MKWPARHILFYYVNPIFGWICRFISLGFAVLSLQRGGCVLFMVRVLILDRILITCCGKFFLGLFFCNLGQRFLSFFSSHSVLYIQTRFSAYLLWQVSSCPAYLTKIHILIPIRICSCQLNFLLFGLSSFRTYEFPSENFLINFCHISEGSTIMLF